MHYTDGLYQEKADQIHQLILEPKSTYYTDGTASIFT